MASSRQQLLWAMAGSITFSALALAPEPRVRNFHFNYVADISNWPKDAQHVELWMPLPHDDPYQQIHRLKIESQTPYRIETAADGNVMLHASIDHPGENPGEKKISFEVSFDAAREEHLQPRLAGARTAGQDESAASLAPYLKPDRLVPIDGKIRQWAHEVVDQAHAHTDLEVARAIYNHVVATVKYDKTGKGWGRGDIYYACEERRGNCTDFHAIFIGYARALGIPARFAIGFPLPSDRGEGKIAGYHCWAEFYAKGIGWIPVDASEAAKNPSKREYFFGAHDENRIEFSKNRDITLAPPQKSDPLNYFVYPYAEVDGRAFAGSSFEVRYRDTSSLN
jgi:transglutaminase-like putative cysteine protease